MADKSEVKNGNIIPRPLTQGEFYLAISEMPNRSLGLDNKFRRFFVGQEKPYDILSNALINSSPGSVIVLSAPPGSGKTTLLNVAMQDLISIGRFNKSDMYIVQESAWHRDIQKAIETKPKLICVDGIRHSDEEVTKQQFHDLNGLLSDQKPTLILLADFVLSDQILISILNSAQEPTQISLDQLTPDQIKETLRRRLAFVLDREEKQIDIDAMFSPRVLTAMAPITQRPTATMRDALLILQEIGGGLKPTEEPLQITGEMIRKIKGAGWQKDFWYISQTEGHAYANEIIKLRLWLLDHINKHANGQNMMRALTLQDIMLECPVEGADENDYQPMIEGSWVFNQVGELPDLYLPKPEEFLKAAFRKFPYNPDSKETQKAESIIAEQSERVVKASLYHGADLLEEGRDFVNSCASYYGWDQPTVFDIFKEVADDIAGKVKKHIEKNQT